MNWSNPLIIIRTPTFRLACLFSCGILVLISAVSGFIYWQASIGIITRADEVLLRDSHILMEDSPENAAAFIERRLAARSHVIVIAGLFDDKGAPLAGNLSHLPNFPLDGHVHALPHNETCCQQVSPETGRVLAQILPDHRVLVLGRNVEGVESLRQTVAEAVLAGIIPAILIALGSGILLGHRTASWMTHVQATAKLIENGDIRQRLPVPESNDQTRWLVESINRILDGIGDVFESTRSTNEHLAHDLLAPLAGIRARLERASSGTDNLDDMRNTVIQAISGLDQTVKLASALLKISTIERGHIRRHFQPVALEHIIAEVGELFSVIAEDKNITLTVQSQHPCILMGDQDLLMEAVANLVDNAIKFTPDGGTVQIYVSQKDGRTVLGVKDNGPGLPSDQRERVLGRFYRGTSKDQTIPGHGLGLSLVDAVVRLHNLHLNFEDAHPGLIVEIVSTASVT